MVTRTNPFTLVPGQSYALEILPGADGVPAHSAITLRAITPLGRGDGRLELVFTGHQMSGLSGEVRLTLQQQSRTAHHLVAEVVEGPAPFGAATLVLSPLTEAWIARFVPGWQPRTPAVAHPAGLAISTIIPGHLYLGPFPTAHHIGDLRALGVQAVLTLLDEKDPQQVGPEVQNAFHWAQVHIRDAYLKGLPTVADLADAVSVLRRWKGEGLERFYLHCLLGQGRSPLVTMAYLVHGYDGQQKWRLTKAIAHVTTQRPQADPNAGQLGVLADYVHQAFHEEAFDPQRYGAKQRVVD